VARVDDGAAPTFVHTCAPARVDVVAAGGRWGDGGGWAGVGDEGKK
jgi:hypothetical protein